MESSASHLPVHHTTPSPRTHFPSPSLLLASLALLVCLCAGSFAAWNDLQRPRFGTDDANMFFVYARHIVQGHGIVYNIGGEHVEGASSLLYLLVCAAVWRCSTQPETVLLALNFCFAAASSLCLFGVLRLLGSRLQLTPARWLILPAVYLVWLLCSPVYFDWCVVSLMDAGIYSLLLVAGYSLLARWLLSAPSATPLRRRALQLSIVVALTILVRPEGIAWALVESCLFAYLFRPVKPTSFLPFGVTLLAEAALTLFRKLYFGYPLPNTFYAKVSASRLDTLRDGLDYGRQLVHFYGFGLLLPACIALVVAAFGFKRREQSFTRRFTVLTVVFVFAGLILPILEGGDNFNGFRMVQSLFPLLAVSAVLPALPLLEHRRWHAASLALFALALLFALTTHSTWKQFREGNASIDRFDTPTSDLINYDLTQRERANGERLRTIFAGRLPTLGTAAAGALTYAYQGPVFDLLGLNDTRMAHADPIKTGYKGHQSFNKQVFYRLAPDILLADAEPTTKPVDLEAVQFDDRNPDEFENAIFKDIFNDADFQTRYVLAAVQSSSAPNLICSGYFRRDYLQQLLASGNFRLIKQL